MSIRSLVEINHDKLAKIEANPEEFVKWLGMVLREGGAYKQMHSDDGYGGETHGQFWNMGGALKHQRHHTDPCPTGIDS